MKPKLLDLFCCAGGAARGYQLAGFHVTGIDIKHQPRYAGDVFIQADGLIYLKKIIDNGEIKQYSAIGASPPCQVFTALARAMKNDPHYHNRHINLIPQTRQLLQEAGLPYIIENVPGAPLVEPIMLCGSMFGLRVYRHRLFETSFFMFSPPHIPHNDKTPRSGRGKSPKGFICVTGNGGASNLGMPYMQYASAAMGIDWMNRPELSQAIPPAYTEWLGQRLMEQVFA